MSEVPTHLAGADWWRSSKLLAAVRPIALRGVKCWPITHLVASTLPPDCMCVLCDCALLGTNLHPDMPLTGETLKRERLDRWRSWVDVSAGSGTEGLTVDYLVGGFRIRLDENSDTPGPRTHILNFSRALVTSGAKVSIFLASSLPLLGAVRNVKHSNYTDVSGLRVWTADLIRVGLSLWCGLAVWLTTRDRRPDVIYERLATFQHLSAFHRGRRSAFRVIEANGILSRETALDRKILRLQKWVGFIERRALRRANLVIAVSEPLKRELMAFAGLSSEQILVIPNGVNGQLLEVSRDIACPPIVGFVGSVVAWHGLDDLLRAVAELLADPNRQEVRVEVIGDGPELDALRGLAESLGLRQAFVATGALSSSLAIQRMSRWSIGYAGHRASSSESMYHSPLKLYEYAALGMSILATPSDDARRLTESGASIHVFDPGDVDALSASLREALDVEGSATKSANSVVSTRCDVRRAIVRDHGWSARAESFLRRMEVEVDGRHDRPQV